MRRTMWISEGPLGHQYPPPTGKALAFLFLATTALFILYLVTQLGLNALAALVGSPSRQGLYLLACGLACAALLASYRSMIVRLEQRRPMELDPQSAWRGLLLGTLLGAAMLGTVQVAAVLSHHSRFVGIADFQQVAVALGSSGVAALGEELIFRGFVFRLVAEYFGLAAALIVSAVIFGAIHAFNPDSTAAGIAGVALEAGILLGLAFALTRTLWMPIGIHFGWNFAEGGIFGSAVSGTAPHGILAFSNDPSPFWTGGAFGFEASVSAVIVCSCVSMAIGLYIRMRGQRDGAAATRALVAG